MAGDGESMGQERGTPVAYRQLSSQFGVLEKAAEDENNGEAALHLTKAKMAFIAALTSKPTW